MMFWDEVEVTFHAGKGGDGRVSFRREKFIPKGGPDGGDGGKGGSILLVADTGENTLMSFARQREFKAPAGAAGGSQNCSGRDAKSLTLFVPVGTLVKDPKRGNVLKDLAKPGDSIVIAKGGRGGRGNKRFANATRRTPRFAEKGKPGETRRVKLELKLVAEVGIIGLPNAGKSTLLATLSAAKPKIASYPFTTLVPELGVVSVPGGRSFVMVDIPGLIEGAHRGVGLGDAFLRHVERTKILLHLVDCSSTATVPSVEAARVIREELRSYSPKLADKPTILVATKLDDPAAAANADALDKAFKTKAIRISAASHLGLKELLGAVVKKLPKPRVRLKTGKRQGQALPL